MATWLELFRLVFFFLHSFSITNSESNISRLLTPKYGSYMMYGPPKVVHVLSLELRWPT